jgi:hypothetical protein
VITNLSYQEAKTTAETMRCAVCNGGLLAPYLGDNTWGVRCLKDESHQGVARPRRTKVLADGVEYDVYTQKPVDQFEREGLMLQRANPQLAEIMVAPPAISSSPMTIEEFDQRMGLIKHVVAQMQNGVHYGVIPGTQDKSLWEPGAEYLRAAFNIAWSYEIIEQVEDYHSWTFRYTIRAFHLLGPGIEGPAWIASGSNRERKFWCRTDCPRPCDQNHEPSMEREMHPHNVRDRVLKRAFVGLIRNVTGTTGYFKAVADSDQERPAALVKRQCVEHKKTYTRREKDGRVWYSHKEGNGYCNADRKLVEQWEKGDTGEPAPTQTPVKPRAVDTETGEIRGGAPENNDNPFVTDYRPPQESPVGDIFAPDEAPDDVGETVPQEYAALVEAAGRDYGLDLEGFCRKVLAAPSIERFQAMGGTPAIAETRWGNWLKKQQRQGGGVGDD